MRLNAFQSAAYRSHLVDGKVALEHAARRAEGSMQNSMYGRQ